MTAWRRLAGQRRAVWAAILIVAVLIGVAYYYLVASTPRSPQILNENTIQREIRPIGDGSDPRFVVPVFEEEEHPDEE